MKALSSIIAEGVLLRLLHILGMLRLADRGNPVRFALVDGVRLEPQPKQRGCCPLCGAEMVAKCGRVKVWHWAHKGRLECDPWYEETEWHRSWKDKFPLEWQEKIAYDEATGEKHIADVRTPSGLVIEFQHSVISSEEVIAREAFYKNMVWGR